MEKWAKSGEGEKCCPFQWKAFVLVREEEEYGNDDEEEDAYVL